MVVDKRCTYESCAKKKIPKSSWNEWVMNGQSWPSKVFFQLLFFVLSSFCGNQKEKKKDLGFW
jgi:hypothetical protein